MDHTQGESHRRATTIDMLFDDILLDIFDFYRSNTLRLVWDWHVLVHVCRRWRQIIFESPLRLNLQILCTHKSPVQKNLDIWPAFPIAIDYSERGITAPGNVISALGHPNRVRRVMLNLTGSDLAKMAATMLEPFPALTHLNIFSSDGNAPVFAANFLGGSAPCLRQLGLCSVPIPALPTLLLSTSDLVNLRLLNIPPTGYISPEAMVAGLAALTRLEILVIAFESATPRPNRIRPPPVTRIVLPALTDFTLQSACEYMEDFVARIDSPQLTRIYIQYLMRLGDVPVVQLSDFVRRSVGLKLTLSRHMQIGFFSDFISFTMTRLGNNPTRNVLCEAYEGSGWQVSNMTKLLSQLSAAKILPNVVHLKLEAEPESNRQLQGMDDVEWLHLLRQFSAVQMLHVSQELAGYVAHALEGITGEMVTEVLPSLNLIRLAGQPASSAAKFIAARGLSDRPVTVVDTTTEFCRRLDSESSVRFYGR